MAESVTHPTDELLQLARWHIAHLTAGPVRNVSPESLGPFLPVLADGAAWRADAAARTHVILSAALDGFLLEDRAFRDGRRQDDVVDALRRRWGLTQPPAQKKQLAEALQVSTPTIDGWERQVATSPNANSAAAAAASLMSRSARPGVPRKSAMRPAWRPDAFEEWPTSNERSALARAAAERLPDGAPVLAESEIIARLRTAAARWAMQYTATDDLVRGHIAASVEPSWRSLDTGAAPLPPTPAPAETSETTAARTRAARVLQLGMHLLTMPGPFGLVPDLIEEVEAGAFFASAAERRGARSAPSMSGDARVDSRLRQVGFETARPGSGLDDAGGSVFTLDTPEGRATTRRLTGLAADIRRSERYAKETLISAYLDLRRAMRDRPLTASQMHEIVLADQSVAHDATTVMMVEAHADLVALSRPLMIQSGLGEYVGFFERDLGLFQAKADRLTSAFWAYHRAGGLVDGVHGDGRAADRRRTEVLQQLRLACAGVFLRCAEYELEQPQPNATRVTRYLMTALGYADQATGHLDELAERFELAMRREDDFVSWAGWKVQTPVIRLRILLACRMVSNADLLLAVPERVHRRFALEEIEQRYLELIEIPQLSERVMPDVVACALTISFLSGGRVPAAGPTAAEVVRRFGFLRSDPTDTSRRAMRTDKVLDADAATRWLEREGTDAGLIDHLPRNGAVALTLDRTGWYLLWRDAHDPVPVERRDAR